MPRFKEVDGVASENSVHLTRGQQLWRDQGLLIATEGNTTDFKFIEATGPSPARSCAISRTKACHWSSSARAFSAWGRPQRNSRALIGRELQHGGNPIATWCASNVSVRKDPAGHEKPDKERSTEKIDAIVAAIMTVGRMHVGGEGARSIYESHDLFVI
jgi:Phage Terminase